MQSGNTEVHQCETPSTHTWLASSRVGDMIRALNPLFLGCFRCVKRGIQNASVFPDPVGAEARSSRPCKKKQRGYIPVEKKNVMAKLSTLMQLIQLQNCHKRSHGPRFWQNPWNPRELTCSMTGIACIWIGVGTWKPAAWIFSMILGWTLYSFWSWSKVAMGSGRSVPWMLILCWFLKRFIYEAKDTLLLFNLTP